MKQGHITYHIGLHKTGTTAIQDFCCRNRELLLRQGLDFPLIGLRESGCRAHTHVDGYARGMPDHYPPTLLENMAAWTPEAGRVLISCEGLYLIAKLPEPAEALARLAEVLPFESADSVVFIRRPDTHIRSLYGQMANRPNGTLSFQTFLERHTEGIRTGKRFIYYRYAPNLEPWRSIGDLTILEYEQGDSVELIMQTLGLEAPNQETNSQQANRQNISPPFEASVLLASANSLLKRGVINALQRKAIHRLLRSVDLARLSQLTGIEIPTLFEAREVDLRAFRSAFLTANDGRFYAGRIPAAIVLPHLRRPEADHHLTLVLRLAGFRLNRQGEIEAVA